MYSYISEFSIYGHQEHVAILIGKIILGIWNKIDVPSTALRRRY